jgi:excisionase family DNA binding protein
VILAVVDETTRRHLLAAVSAHLVSLRRDGVPVPPEVPALATVLRSGGQRVPESANVRRSHTAAAPSASEVLAVDYRTAAQRLGVSVRTLKRRVAAGELPVVEIGGCRRIRESDLEAYVASLPVVNDGDMQAAAGAVVTPQGVERTRV